MGRKRYHVGCLMTGPRSNYVVGGVSFPHQTEIVAAGTNGAQTQRSRRFGAIVQLDDDQVAAVRQDMHRHVVRSRETMGATANAAPVIVGSIEDAQRWDYREMPADRPVGMVIYMQEIDAAYPPADDPVVTPLIASRDEWVRPTPDPEPAVAERQGGVDQMSQALTAALREAFAPMIAELIAAQGGKSRGK